MTEFDRMNERRIQQRIDEYEERAKKAKRQYQALAAFHTQQGLREALAILKGEDPEKVWMGNDDDA